MTSIFEALRPPVAQTLTRYITYWVKDEGVFTQQLEAAYAPHSLAFFCPTCCDLWAKVNCDLEPGQVEVVPCRRHGPAGVSDWAKWPGSILHSPGLTSRNLSTMWWAVALDFLPLPLLQREFELALTEAERHGKVEKETDCS